MGAVVRPPIRPDGSHTFDRPPAWRQQDRVGVKECQDTRGVVADPGLHERGVEGLNRGPVAIGKGTRTRNTARGSGATGGTDKKAGEQ